MAIYKQPAPFAVQIEPVEGCSLACHFCALQTLRDNGADWRTGVNGKNSGPFKYMSADTLRRISKGIMDLGWTSRIELAMHGEPTLHPDIVQIVRMLRRCLPKNQIMITSNGGGLLHVDKIFTLFEVGLDILALDDYKHANLVSRILDTLEELAGPDESLTDYLANLGIKFRRYPQDKDGSPHHRLKKGEKLLTIIQDIASNDEGTHIITNQGGSVGNPDPSMKHSRCAKPFRELSFRWDGSVAICCDDWSGQYKIGNINEMGLLEIWHHPRFDAARRKLYHGQRDFGPCNGCNVRSYRVGLLPDKMGKDTMPEPTERTDTLIKFALAGKPFTLPVRRGT